MSSTIKGPVSAKEIILQLVDASTLSAEEKLDRLLQCDNTANAIRNDLLKFFQNVENVEMELVLQEGWTSSYTDAKNNVQKDECGIMSVYGINIKDLPEDARMEALDKIHRIRTEDNEQRLKERALDAKIEKEKRKYKLKENEQKLHEIQLRENETKKRLEMEEYEMKRKLDLLEKEKEKQLDMEEHERKRKLDMEEYEKKKSLQIAELQHRNELKKTAHAQRMEILSFQKQRREQKRPTLVDAVWPLRPSEGTEFSKEVVQEKIWEIVNKSGSRRLLWRGINVKDHRHKVLEFNVRCPIDHRQAYIKKLVAKIWP